MKKEDILGTHAMPAFSPSYPAGPYYFKRREYLIITYESDPEAVREALPEPLEPTGDRKNLCFYEWMNMPDSSGFGDYVESGSGIIATYKGEPCNFSVQMYLNDEPPITAGREIWGFPKKWGEPKLGVTKDTLTGTLHYDGIPVAVGTMGYKHVSLEAKLAEVKKRHRETQYQPQAHTRRQGKASDCRAGRLLPSGCRGPRRVGRAGGPGTVPPRQLPRGPPCRSKKIISGRHQIVDFTLPYGEVLHDYLAK